MKRIVLGLIVIAVLASVACQKQEKTIALDTQEKKQSYVFGMNIAQQLKSSDEALDLEALIQGLRDHYTGAPEKMTEAEINQVMQAYRNSQQQRMGEKAKQMEQLASQNKAEEEAFLKDNGAKEGVKTTATGLQYKVLTAGTGDTPKATDTVKVHYRGTFIDGKEFDSSYKSNTPAQFPLNGVIPGWTEGLQLMKVGSKFQFFIPFRLAYGEQGRSPIPPSKMLIFEVELLEIVK